MTEAEKREWEERFRKEAEEEQQRLQQFLQARATEDEALAKQAELAELRRQVREGVWKERGYVRYVDSRGSETWVSPDEYARRMKRRNERRDPLAEVVWSDLGKQVIIGAIVVAFAVALGVLLTSSLR